MRPSPWKGDVIYRHLYSLSHPQAQIGLERVFFRASAFAYVPESVRVPDPAAKPGVLNQGRAIVGARRDQGLAAILPE